MADHDLTHDQQEHAEGHAAYLKVFVVLLIFTILEYLYATYMPVGFVMLVLGLMSMAVFKATLVAIYFMHLKFEGRWVYFLLIPAGFLATVFICALYPDIGMTGSTPAESSESEDDLSANPPLPVRSLERPLA
jgi:cytochrome c oxidase subunit 4